MLRDCKCLDSQDQVSCVCQVSLCLSINPWTESDGAHARLSDLPDHPVRSSSVRPFFRHPGCCARQTNTTTHKTGESNTLTKRKLTCLYGVSLPAHRRTRHPAHGHADNSIARCARPRPTSIELRLRSGPASTRLTRADSRDDAPLPDERSAPGSAPCGGPTDPSRAYGGPTRRAYPRRASSSISRKVSRGGHEHTRLRSP